MDLQQTPDDFARLLDPICPDIVEDERAKGMHILDDLQGSYRPLAPLGAVIETK